MDLSTPTKLVAGCALLGAIGATGWRYGEGVRALTPPTEAAADVNPLRPHDAGRLLASPVVASPVVEANARCADTARGGSLVGCDPDELPAPEGHVSQDPALGAYHAPAVVRDSPRVYPLTRNVWVRPNPSARDSWIGFLWFGSSVKLRHPEPRSGPGCKGHWYAIEPRGFVCVDERRATLDPDHPVVQGITGYSPNVASPWPHRYGESIDARVYRTLPSPKRQQAHEWYYRSHDALVTRARGGEVIEALAGIDLTPAPDTPLLLPMLPGTLQSDTTRLIKRSTVAWTKETQHEGRSFLLTDDLKWVPKDRVVQYPTVTFRGVHLGQEARLPLAFFRGSDRESYLRYADGSLKPSTERFERLSWVELTGVETELEGETYLETRRNGLFVKAADAVVPRPRKKTPWGTPLDAAEDPKAKKRGRNTWIEVSILGGWLLAYEGQKPVFTTLVSAGRGGPPHGDRDPIETASTPVGRFKITGKFATATMIAPNELTHSSVPWAQNFSGPHALHAAYWHDRWGELQSGGCLNVSPIDGRWLQEHFTEPKLPEGWHGVRWLPKLESATTLIVRRR